MKSVLISTKRSKSKSRSVSKNQKRREKSRDKARKEEKKHEYNKNKHRKRSYSGSSSSRTEKKYKEKKLLSNKRKKSRSRELREITEEKEVKKVEELKPNKVEKENKTEENVVKKTTTTNNFNDAVNSRAGGVYIPPFKLAMMYEQIRERNDKNSVDYQKMMWEMLRKSINGIINKVNLSNIQNVIYELFNENLLRGKGLLTRAIIKAQMASPNFTHVYASLISVLNTKLPDIARLVVERYVIQFQRAYKRNNKIVCMAASKMIAHLINQQVVHEILALEILTLFLESPTEDSVEMACDFMTECGQVLSEIYPPGKFTK